MSRQQRLGPRCEPPRSGPARAGRPGAHRRGGGSWRAATGRRLAGLASLRAEGRGHEAARAGRTGQGECRRCATHVPRGRRPALPRRRRPADAEAFQGVDDLTGLNGPFQRIRHTTSSYTSGSTTVNATGCRPLPRASLPAMPAPPRLRQAPPRRVTPCHSDHLPSLERLRTMMVQAHDNHVPAPRTEPSFSSKQRLRGIHKLAANLHESMIWCTCNP
jgi:hypothetical protein